MRISRQPDRGPCDWGSLGRAILLAVVMTIGPILPVKAQVTGFFVVGNQLIDPNGNLVRLLGIDRSGSEYMCLAGGPIFDGPVDSNAIAAIAYWQVNVVRVPLNEDCWLGTNLDPANPDQGARYRNAIVAFVARLNAAGIYAILDLHWNAPGTHIAKMADLDHAPAFWAPVAATFKGNPGVIFDLYNKPHDISWRCWRDGCPVTTNLGSWQTAGMQTLVAAVRKAGAIQPIMLGGLGYASDLSKWLTFKPKDPLTNSPANPLPGRSALIAAYHTYCGPPGTNTRCARIRSALCRPGGKFH
jgi:endoglucanase